MNGLIQKGWQRPGWLNWLLLPVTWIYIMVVQLRKFAYGIGLLQSHRITAPVIVVGNMDFQLLAENYYPG